MKYNIVIFWPVGRSHLIEEIITLSLWPQQSDVQPKIKVEAISFDETESEINNHPSGVVVPSEADIKITKKIKDSGALPAIAVLDHIIIGHDTYYSFADEGCM